MARIPLGLTGLIVAGSQITPSLSARPWGMWTTYLSPELRILGEAHRRGKPSTYRMVHLRRRVTNTPCDDMPDDSGQPVAIPPEAVDGGLRSMLGSYWNTSSRCFRQLANHDPATTAGDMYTRIASSLASVSQF